MPATIKIAIDKLDEHLISELKEKYKGAELEITVRRSDEATLISEDDFWLLIDLLAWEKEADEEITAPLIIALAALPMSKIYGFQELLAEKLYALDQEKYAQYTNGYSDHLSVDGFLYDRLCVVANGKEAYEEVLANPELMPADLSFEPLLYVAGKAFQSKTGKRMDYIPMVSYETYSNLEGWPKKK